LLQIVWTGFAASTYAILFAVAFSLVVKVVKVWNFAQAGVMALSFYVMYAAHNKFGIPILPSVGIGLVCHDWGQCVHGQVWPANS
jgi:branched-chain amino acid transport system permease protein